MCDVARRIGGRDSHPDFHRVLVNALFFSKAALKRKDRGLMLAPGAALGVILTLISPKRGCSPSGATLLYDAPSTPILWGD